MALRAEAGRVPPGLAWQAGGVRLIAREALLTRRAGRSLAFAAAGAWVVWAGRRVRGGACPYGGQGQLEQVADNPAAVPHLNQDASVPAMTGMIYTWVFESLFLLVPREPPGPDMAPIRPD